VSRLTSSPRPDATGTLQRDPRNILFACTMNAIRSPMAAGLLTHLAGHRFEATSAGVHAGDPDYFACSGMEELGIDLTEHTPQRVADLDDATFDLIVSLSPEAHHQALELTRTMAVDVEYWPTIDPSVAEGSRDHILDAYRISRNAIYHRLKTRFDLTGSPGI